MRINYYWLFWICIFGACLGSFYNVAILRSLSGESIVSPPSKCPKCNHKLLWWHNIPIISYIILQGQCYFCKQKISIQYPVVEFITMLLFGLTYLKFRLSLQTLLVLIVLSCFIIMTATDIKEKVVDCKIAIGLAIVGFIYACLSAGLNGAISSVLGLVAGAVILEIIARSGYLFVKTRAMGEADTYVAAAIGACFGINNILPILFYSLVASMFFVLPVFLYKRFKSGDKLTCMMLLVFMLSIFVFQNIEQNYFTLGILAFSGTLLAYLIIKNMNQTKTNNYFPFVPALAAGVLYFITVCF